MNIVTRTVLVVIGLVMAACASTMPAPEAREALAPTGKLRVALFEGNALHAVRDPASGALRGVSHDLGRELSARLGILFEPILFANLGKMLDAGKAGAWDISFIAMTPDRESFFDFTANHIEVEYGYLVPGNSAIARVDDVDRAGVRIAVVERGSPDLFLTRELRNATLLRVAGLPAAVQLVREGKADAIAGQKPSMHGISAQLAGSRVLDGHPGKEGVAVAIPKGRQPAALAFSRAFVAEGKSDGMVRATIARSGLRGVVVAPAE